MQTWDKVPLWTEGLQYGIAHAGHNVHVANDIWAIGYFDSDLCDVRADGSH